MAVPETTGVKNAGGITRFMRETKVELKKVTWPTKQELIANTAVVLIIMIWKKAVCPRPVSPPYT